MILLFDIGGTKTRLTVLRDGSDMGKPLIIPTERRFDDAMRIVGEAGKTLLRGERAETIAGGIAGVLNSDKSGVVNASHVGEDWAGKPLKRTLEEMFGSAVILENDAALAGLGEATYGAGRGHAIVAYLTISTGVGGARIVDGAIDASAQGFEPGHHIIDAKTRMTLEEAVSGSGIERRFGAKPEAIQNPALWEELAEKLAVGIHNAIVFWSPDIVILGGSMILGNPAISLERVRAHLEAFPQIFLEFPKIEKSALGDFAGLYGALVLASR